MKIKGLTKEQKEENLILYEHYKLIFIRKNVTMKDLKGFFSSDGKGKNAFEKYAFKVMMDSGLDLKEEEVYKRVTLFYDDLLTELDIYE